MNVCQSAKKKHRGGKRHAGKVISQGKNAGKQMLGKKDNPNKMSRRAKKKMNQEQRTAERQFKNSGYDGR